MTERPPNGDADADADADADGARADGARADDSRADAADAAHGAAARADAADAAEGAVAGAVDADAAEGAVAGAVDADAAEGAVADAGTDPQGEAHPWELRPATDLDLPVGERLRSLSRERGLVDTAIGFVWWGGMRVYMRTYHRLRVDGLEHLPKAAPFVMVANHSSHLDAMTLACVLARRLRHCVYPIAAGDHFFQSPAAATFAAFVLNALPMWRRSTGRYAMQQLRERLVEEPCGFILFPEGTRSRTGEMARFKPGLGMLVAGTEVPVIPCYLDGAFKALPHDKKLPRPRRVVLRVGAPLRFAALANERSGWSAVAQAVEAGVRALAPRAID